MLISMVIDYITAAEMKTYLWPQPSGMEVVAQVQAKRWSGATDTNLSTTMAAECVAGLNLLTPLGLYIFQ